MRSVLSVKSLRDDSSQVNLVQDLVGVFLESRSENDNFVVFAHILQELRASGSLQEVALLLELRRGLDNKLTSMLWIKVSSRSKTRVYTSESRGSGSKKGGETLGKLAKLLGKMALLFEAIAEAFKIAKGFLPVIPGLEEEAPEELWSAFLGFRASPASLPDWLSAIFPF